MPWEFNYVLQPLLLLAMLLVLFPLPLLLRPLYHRALSPSMLWKGSLCLAVIFCGADKQPHLLLGSLGYQDLAEDSLERRR